MDRFWDKVDRSGGPNACWEWLAFKEDGYGKFQINGRSLRAHRVAYEMLVAPICPGHDLHHAVCGNRACVNPAHVQPLTHSAHGRLKNAGQTHCRHGHPLSGENLYVYPDGRRQCQACSNKSKRAYRERKKVV